MKLFRELVEVMLEGKDEAAEIRGILKNKLGLTSRDVSVKASHGGMSSAVNVNIRTLKALLRKQEIEEIGNARQSYETDEYTGEILSGGNTFIFTQIDWDFKKEMTDLIQAEVMKEAGGELKAGDQVTIYKTFIVTNDGDRGYWTSKKGGGGQVSSTNHVSGIGSMVMSLISNLKDDSLYGKIK